MDDIIPQKRCPVCKQPYPLTAEYFHRNNSAKSGFQNRCKQCMKELVKLQELRPTRKAYLMAHAEEKRQYRREHGKTHAEEYKQYSQMYRRSHPEEIQMYNQQYWQSHLEESRQYRQTHADQLHAHRHTRRARKKAIPGYYTAQDVLDKYQQQKGCCYYCQHPFGKGKNAFHVDHIIPLSRDGATNWPDNIVLACPTCNLSKGNKLPHEWYEGRRLP